MQSTKAAITTGTRSFILVTAFLNLAGIGIIIPVTPFIIQPYVAQKDAAFVNALLFTTYSLFVFLAVPTLGALSDRYGRRPILLISLLGSAIGYLFLGIGGSLVMLFIGRIIDGITGGNIATIFAYAADITEPKDRTKFFGQIGAVSGLAFVIGPALGGILWKVTNLYSAPLYFSALVYLLNTLWGFSAMPESLSQDRRAEIKVSRLNPFTQLFDAFNIKQIRFLLFAVFFWTLAFALLQSNLSILTEDKLGWQPDNTSLLLGLIGLIGIIMQGLIIPRLLKRYGEGPLAVAGMFTMMLGLLLYAVVALTLLVPLIFVSAFFVAVGNGLITPTVTGMLSQSVGFREQGRVQGGNQAVQALARVFGPLWGGTVYGISAAIPYFSAALMVAVGGFLVVAAVPIVRSHKAAMAASAPTGAPAGQPGGGPPSGVGH